MSLSVILPKVPTLSRPAVFDADHVCFDSLSLPLTASEASGKNGRSSADKGCLHTVRSAWITDPQSMLVAPVMISAVGISLGPWQSLSGCQNWKMSIAIFQPRFPPDGTCQRPHAA